MHISSKFKGLVPFFTNQKSSIKWNEEVVIVFKPPGLKKTSLTNISIQLRYQNSE